MSQDQPIAPFDWFANQFTSEGRAEFIDQIGPHLAHLFKPGDRVLDLCCGSGPIAFFLEERGAQVTGIDLAPSLISAAHQEAIRRNSYAQFIQANVLTHPLGNDEYDLAMCLGNAILDFPHKSFPQFRDLVYQALKPGGQFAIEYLDGFSRIMDLRAPGEVVEQGVEGQIVRRFKEYDPVLSVYRMEYLHLSSGETYDYTGYIYTGPMIRLVMETRFDFKYSVRLSDADFMDVYSK
jgi:SAM-dependent methyltransferase